MLNGRRNSRFGECKSLIKRPKCSRLFPCGCASVRSFLLKDKFKMPPHYGCVHIIIGMVLTLPRVWISIVQSIVVWRAHSFPHIHTQQQQQQHLNMHCRRCLLCDQVQDPTICLCAISCSLFPHAKPSHCWNEHTNFRVQQLCSSTSNRAINDHRHHRSLRRRHHYFTIPPSLSLPLLPNGYTTHCKRVNEYNAFCTSIESERRRKKKHPKQQERRKRRQMIRKSIPFIHSIECCCEMRAVRVLELAPAHAQRHLVSRCFKAAPKRKLSNKRERKWSRKSRGERRAGQNKNQTTFV